MPFRVTAIGILPGGEQWMNTFHFLGTASPGDAEVGDAFDAVLAFYGAFNDRLVDSWSLTRLTAANVGGPVVEEDAVTGLVGEVATAPMPNDLAVLVKWTTADPSRTGKGRSFIGGWPLSASVENGTNGAAVVDGGPAGALAAAAATFVAGATFTPGIWSRPALDADPPRPIGSFNQLTGGSVSRRWSTQRRRDLETPRLEVPFP